MKKIIIREPQINDKEIFMAAMQSSQAVGEGSYFIRGFYQYDISLL